MPAEAYIGHVAKSENSQNLPKTTENQQKNPHTPRTMKSLGLNEADVDKFCTDMLFPKIA